MKYVKKTLVIVATLLILSSLIGLNVKLYDKFNTPKIEEHEEQINQLYTERCNRYGICDANVVIPEELQKIAQCESGNTHYEKDGVTVLRGKLNNLDVGKYQINLYFHQKQAEEMRIDLFSEKGNEEYALWLYEKEGSIPWNWSKSCWSK